MRSVLVLVLGLGGCAATEPQDSVIADLTPAPIPNRTVDQRRQRDGIKQTDGSELGGAAYIGIQVAQMAAALAGTGKR